MFYFGTIIKNGNAFLKPCNLLTKFSKCSNMEDVKRKGGFTVWNVF